MLTNQHQMYTYGENIAFLNTRISESLRVMLSLSKGWIALSKPSADPGDRNDR